MQKCFIFFFFLLPLLSLAQVNTQVIANLADNTWVKLTESGAVPNNIHHTTMVADPDKDKLYLYGSDTHSDRNNYKNTIWAFDINTGVWSTLYPSDDSTAYTKDAQFHPLTTTGHPVASHVFDGMDYISSMHCIIVVQNPKHAMSTPFGGPYDDWIWPALRPTLWLFNTDSGQWTLCKKRILTDTEIFINASAYSPDENAFYWEKRGSGMYRFTLADSNWTLVNTWGRGDEYHTVMDYDTYYDRFLIRPGLGSSKLFAYKPSDNTWTELGNASGATPFLANGIAMGFDTVNAVLICHGVDPAYSSDQYNSTDPEGRALTHVYDVRQGKWIDPNPANRPPHWGFNFKGDYDPKNNVFFYLTYPKGSSRIDVWAYRYKAAPAAVQAGGGNASPRPRIIAGPNPFSRAVSIEVSHCSGPVTLFDVRGRSVAALEPAAPGRFFWRPRALPAGVYMIRAKAEKQTITKKVLYVP